MNRNSLFSHSQTPLLGGVIALRAMGWVLLCLLVPVSCLLALDPQSCTITNLRNEANQPISTYEFYQGYSLVFTNCLARGASLSSTQDLTDCLLILKVGLASSNVSVTCAVQNATQGIWSAVITLPTNTTTPYVFLSVSNTNSSVNFPYPLKILNTRPAL
jgi:hypothetical protein